MPDVVTISHLDMLAHDPGRGHPERPDRLQVALEGLRDDGVEIVNATVATPAQLALVHTEGYVDAMLARAEQSFQFEPETMASRGSVTAARLAAGAAVGAVDTLLDGTATRAMAIVRPPGHHAEADHAMGFCMFNNIAVAAAWAVARGCRRVLIVDWDVHHGNGTQHIFETRDDVVFISSHRAPFYPGTGAAEERGRDAGLGWTMNLPVPAGVGDAEVVGLHAAAVPRLAARARPDLVLISAGFDADARDPIGGLTMTPAGFAALTAQAVAIADAGAGGRVALVLEGGYDLVALREGVAACRDALAGAATPEIQATPASETFIARCREQFPWHFD